MSKYNNLAFFTLLTTISFGCCANEPVQTVENLFDAMRSHDSSKVAAQFASGALMQRAETNGEIKHNNIERFAEFVGQTDKYLDEQLLSVTVQQSGNLATVWTPYVFYLDNKLSHCGVNSFQLVKQSAEWKIQYIIDNIYTGDCKVFIKQHTF